MFVTFRPYGHFARVLYYVLVFAAVGFPFRSYLEVTDDKTERLVTVRSPWVKLGSAAVQLLALV